MQNLKKYIMKKIGLLFAFAILFSCSGDDDSSCASAASASTTAIASFQANQTDANCLAAKAALENQQDVCGSLSSALAGTLAGLSCN